MERVMTDESAYSKIFTDKFQARQKRIDDIKFQARIQDSSNPVNQLLDYFLIDSSQHEIDRLKEQLMANDQYKAQLAYVSPFLTMEMFILNDEELSKELRDVYDEIRKSSHKKYSVSIEIVESSTTILFTNRVGELKTVSYNIPMDTVDKVLDHQYQVFAQKFPPQKVVFEPKLSQQRQTDDNVRINLLAGNDSGENPLKKAGRVFAGMGSTLFNIGSDQTDVGHKTMHQEGLCEGFVYAAAIKLVNALNQSQIDINNLERDCTALWQVDGASADRFFIDSANYYQLMQQMLKKDKEESTEEMSLDDKQMALIRINDSHTVLCGRVGEKYVLRDPNESKTHVVAKKDLQSGIKSMVENHLKGDENIDPNRQPKIKYTIIPEQIIQFGLGPWQKGGMKQEIKQSPRIDHIQKLLAEPGQFYYKKNSGGDSELIRFTHELTDLEGDSIGAAKKRGLYYLPDSILGRITDREKFKLSDLDLNCGPNEVENNLRTQYRIGQIKKVGEEDLTYALALNIGAKDNFERQQISIPEKQVLNIVGGEHDQTLREQSNNWFFRGRNDEFQVNGSGEHKAEISYDNSRLTRVWRLLSFQKSYHIHLSIGEESYQLDGKNIDEVLGKLKSKITTYCEKVNKAYEDNHHKQSIKKAQKDLRDQVKSHLGPGHP